MFQAGSLVADSSETTGLKWQAPAGGGKVLQVVQATYSTATTVSSTTMTDTGLSTSITPSSTNSKVLVLTHQLFRNASADSNWPEARGGRVKLLRGSTTIVDTINGEIGIFVNGISGPVQGIALFNYAYLDSPSTTSSTTYKTQCATGNGAIIANYEAHMSTIILMEIGA